MQYNVRKDLIHILRSLIEAQMKNGYLLLLLLLRSCLVQGFVLLGTALGTSESKAKKSKERQKPLLV
ncbi:MAG: hypothetical protein EBZ21_07240 [Flavobacteriia bacterium]|nr:hypothetical protein [Flavobacteriia bacterium]